MQQQAVSRIPAEPADADGAANSADATLAPEPIPERRRLRRTLFIAGPALVLVAGLVLYFGGGRYVSTEDAYVKANKVTVSAEVGGRIAAVAVRENQAVARGDELFHLDDRTFRIALQRAEAQLLTVRSDIEGLKAGYRQKEQQLQLAQSNAVYAEREYNRQAQLAQQRLTSQAKLDETQHSLDTARRQIAVIEQERAQLLSQLAGSASIDAEHHPQFAAAKASRDAAALDLERSVVRAPFAGITSRVPEVGQHVSAGAAVMSVIATDTIWVEANMLETDLAHLRVGQAATIRIDTYPQHRWQGQVQSISQATGAEFSVLPPQNASGNWVKIAQRIPVRISVSSGADDPPLRMGMTATVRVDTGEHRLPGPLRQLAGGAAAH